MAAFLAVMLLESLAFALLGGINGIQFILGSLLAIVVLAAPAALATAVGLLVLRSRSRRAAAVACGVIAGCVGFAVVRVYVAAVDYGPTGDPGGDLQHNATILMTTLHVVAGVLTGALSGSSSRTSRRQR